MGMRWVLALVLVCASALWGEVLLPGPITPDMKLPDANRARIVDGALHIDTQGNVTWRYPVNPQWKKIRVRAEFRVQGLKLGKETWQNARVMVRFDEKDGRNNEFGQQWYGGAPSLSADSDWQTQETISDVPAGAGYLCVVPAVFAQAGTMDLRRLEIEALDETQSHSAVAKAFLAPLPEAPNGPIINGGFEDDKKSWTGWGDSTAIASEGTNHFLRASRKEIGWSNIVSVYRLPASVRAIRVNAKVRVADPKQGPEGWQWPRIFVTPLNELGEHVGGWPNVTIQSDSPWSERSFVADFPPEARAFRLEVGLFNSAGTMDVDDIRFEYLSPGGAPITLQKQLEPARDAQKIVNSTSTRAEMIINGLWRFIPAVGDAADQPKGDWGWIWVPGSWKTTERVPGLAAGGLTGPWTAFDPETNARGWYEHRFNVPQEWAGRTVMLDLERISTDATVWCNGAEAGKVNWPGGQVDLTKTIKPGENVLRLLVVSVLTEKESANLMGVGAGQVTKTEAKLDTRGIIGDVRILSYPAAAHVSDVFVKTSTRKKQVTLDVELTGLAKAGEVNFVATMLDERGNPEKVFEGKTQAAAADLQRVEVTFDWKNPRLWDLDQPNLYTLKLAAFGPGLRDEYMQRFGFREFWIGADDGKQPDKQGVLPNRLKFFLNGTEFRMRPNCWDDSYELTNSMREGAEGYIRGFRSVGFNTAEIWPTRKAERGTLNAREIWMTAADEMGMPLLGAGPDSTAYVVNLSNWTFTWDKRKAEYEKYAEAEIRKMRNHPSVFVYSTNANFFGHNQDQNPRYIGRQGWPVDQDKSYTQRQAAGAQSLQFIKKLDPTRPVFTHMGGQGFGDISATNHYLCFIPLQEREEWMSYWAQRGDLPYIAIEFGTPLSCSFMRGHMNGGFWGVEPGGAMVSEPLVTEFSAIYLGAKAYQQEMPDYRQLIAAKFIKEQLYNASTDLPLVASPDLQDIQQLFVRNTWRSWRTLGISSMVPWSMAHGWEGTGTNDPVRMPAFEAGRRGAYFPTLPSKTVNRLQDPTGRRPNPAAATLKEALADTMAWIAGPEQLEYPTSKVRESTNAPAADAAPAFMSKDHNFYGGELLAKQVVLMNDARRDLPYQYRFVAKLGEQTLLDSTDRGTLAISQTKFAPYSIRLPEVNTRRTGTIILSAKIGDRVHTDQFTFTVFPKLQPVERLSVSIFDPEGQTTALLNRLGIRTISWNGRSNIVSREKPVLVIGRNALLKGDLPADLAVTVKSGKNVVIMAQDPQYARESLGLRINRHVSRRVFTLPHSHPITQGLSADDLRDWRGEGTLVEPYPPAESMTDESPYGWKWGNRGSVSSAAIEKPHHSAWTPILECEFDLAYSPLMEMQLGGGTAILCTLDLEGRTAADPVADLLARQIIEYLASRPAKWTPASYVGDGSRKGLLQGLGVNFETGDNEFDYQLILADRGADLPKLRKAAEGGATVVVLPQTQMSDLAPLRWVKGAYPTSEVPDRPELAGLSQSDLHWRVPCDAMLLAEKPGMDLFAGGQIGIEKIGAGRVIYAQLDPDRYNADVTTYYRFTRWRQTRALAQLLANAGVTFQMDTRVLKPWREADHQVALSGEWQARITRREQPLPDGTIPDKGMGDLAKALVSPNSPADGWKNVTVPGLWEAYGGEWGEFDGEAVFRKVVEIPADLAGKELVVHLGAVDDFDDTFWDGQPIGRTDINVPQFWSLPREYKLTPEQTKAGRHTLAVRVFDHKGGGGFGGTPAIMAIRRPAEMKLGLYHRDYRADHDLGDDPAAYKRW